MTDRPYGNYPDLSGVRRVLVIVLKNIGDVVLSSPVFSVLRERIPGCTVDALVNSGTDEVLSGNPCIGRTIVLDRKALKGPISRLREEVRLIREVRNPGYDLAICLSNGDRTRHLAMLSRAKIRVGAPPGGSFLHKIFYPINVPVSHAPSKRHYVERNLDCLRRIGIFPEEGLKKTVLYEGEEARAKALRLLKGAGAPEKGPYMVVHPTSRWMFKCWPHGKVAVLIDRVQKELNIPVVVTSGPDEAELSYIIKTIGAMKTGVADLSGKLTLRELGAVIRGARLFFGVDSAPMHISAAVGTPVVALFGPTSSHDWAPWGEGHTVITSTRHSCVPCGRDGCGGSKVSECLTDIGVDVVFRAIKEKLHKDA